MGRDEKPVIKPEQPRGFYLTPEMLMQLNEEDVKDILSYKYGYGLDRDKILTNEKSVKFVKAGNFSKKDYYKDWYGNYHKIYSKVETHARVDFDVAYVGELDQNQIKKFHALRQFSRQGQQYYILRGRIYVTRYGFDCGDSKNRYKDLYTSFDEELGRKIRDNVEERTMKKEEQKEAQKPTRAHQTSLTDWEDNAAVVKPQKVSKEETVEHESIQDQTNKIVENIKKRHHEISSVSILDIENIKNKQNGRPECHFVAEAEGYDYDEELDEDGDYPITRYLITGMKSGKYFESHIEKK